jgi:hypothetical protein
MFKAENRSAPELEADVLAGSVSGCAGFIGTSGSTPDFTIIRSPFGFSQMSCPCGVLLTRSQPHWDARHTIAGLNISTGPIDFAFMVVNLHDAFHSLWSSSWRMHCKT